MLSGNLVDQPQSDLNFGLIRHEPSHRGLRVQMIEFYERNDPERGK